MKRSGRRWVGLCPFHAEKTPSFTVSPDLGLFKCFGCGKGGDLFSFLQAREGVTFGESLRMLADRAGVELGFSGDGSDGGVGRAELARVNIWAAGQFRKNLNDDELGRNARDYLNSRGFSAEIIERFGVGLAPGQRGQLLDQAKRAGLSAELLSAADLSRDGEYGPSYDTFRERLMFPIRDATARVVGFGGRTMVDDRAKYLNTRQTALFDKGRGLYGIDIARTAMSERRRAVVVEGYTDVLAAHQAGFSETVATLGTAMTDTQVELLRRYCDEVILLFDSDDAGEAAADRAITVALPRSVTVRLARIPDGKDPCDFLLHHAAGEFSDVLNGAVDALEFKWSRTCARYEGDGRDSSRREAVMDFLRVVASSAATDAVDAIQRGLLVNQVAHLLGMDGSAVHRLIERLQARTRKGRTAPEHVDSNRPSAPDDQEQAAWTHLLEVLVNEPALLSGEFELPDTGRIASMRDRRIAELLIRLQSELGDVRLADVIAGCEDEHEAARVAELAARGAARGNFEATVKLAARRIREAASSQGLDMGTRRLLSRKSDGVESSADGRAHVHDELRKRSHFAPRRLVREVSGTNVDAVATASEQDITLE